VPAPSIPTGRTEKGIKMKRKTLTLPVALLLLREAADYMCNEDPGQGDYCLCGAYVGSGQKHLKNCLYLRIVKELNR
jgi:hypothetical protein